MNTFAAKHTSAMLLVAHSKKNPFVRNSFVTQVTNTMTLMVMVKELTPNCAPTKYLCGPFPKVSVLFKLLMVCSKKQPSADTADDICI